MPTLASHIRAIDVRTKRFPSGEGAINMKRVSIRSLMVFVAFAAIALTSLRNANAWWAGITLLLALAAVGMAVIGAAMMRGRARCWWASFALFSAGYLVVTFAPGISASVGQNLVTTTALDYLYSQFAASSTEARLPQVLWWQHARVMAEVDRLRAENRQPGDRELDREMRMLINLQTQLRGTADKRDYLRVGHSLFSLLAGLLGGTIAVWFYKERERDEAA